MGLLAIVLPGPVAAGQAESRRYTGSVTEVEYDPPDLEHLESEVALELLPDLATVTGSIHALLTQPSTDWCSRLVVDIPPGAVVAVEDGGQILLTGTVPSTGTTPGGLSPPGGPCANDFADRGLMAFEAIIDGPLLVGSLTGSDTVVWFEAVDVDPATAISSALGSELEAERALSEQLLFGVGPVALAGGEVGVDPDTGTISYPADGWRFQGTLENARSVLGGPGFTPPDANPATVEAVVEFVSLAGTLAGLQIDGCTSTTGSQSECAIYPSVRAVFHGPARYSSLGEFEGRQKSLMQVLVESATDGVGDDESEALALRRFVTLLIAQDDLKILASGLTAAPP